MDPGKMRHRITFQMPGGGVDEHGDPADVWEDVTTVWAAIDPISGREFYAAEQSQSEVSHKVRIRFRAGLTTAMQIKFGQRAFRIISIINWAERGEGLLIMCKELVL